jgi:hypothetical protein
VEFIILISWQEQHNAPLERMEPMEIWFYKHIAPTEQAVEQPADLRGFLFANRKQFINYPTFLCNRFSI